MMSAGELRFLCCCLLLSLPVNLHFPNFASRLIAQNLPPLLPVHSRNGKLYPLGDVCGVVADTFKVFGYHPNIYGVFSGIGVLVDYADEVDSLSPQHSLFQEFLS